MQILSRRAQSRKKVYYDKHAINKLLTLSNSKVKEDLREEITEEDIIEIGYKKDIMEKEILNHYIEKKMLIDVRR